MSNGPSFSFTWFCARKDLEEKKFLQRGRPNAGGARRYGVCGDRSRRAATGRLQAEQSDVFANMAGAMSSNRDCDDVIASRSRGTQPLSHLCSTLNPSSKQQFRSRQLLYARRTFILTRLELPGATRTRHGCAWCETGEPGRCKGRSGA